MFAIAKGDMANEKKLKKQNPHVFPEKGGYFNKR
jgi:hypothetical protein